MNLHAWSSIFSTSHILGDTAAKKNIFSQTSSPALARIGTVPYATSIRSGPEGAQGVLAYVALSLSFSFSSVSLSSIFALIVFPGPSDNVPHLAQDCSLFLFCLSFQFLQIFPLSVFFSFSKSFFDNCFDELSSFGYPFFEHDLCIDLSSIWGWILVSLLMFVRYLSRSHMQPSKPSKTFFTTNFNVFTFQRIMIFNDFPDLFHYQFWY